MVHKKNIMNNLFKYKSNNEGRKQSLYEKGGTKPISQSKKKTILKTHILDLIFKFKFRVWNIPKNDLSHDCFKMVISQTFFIEIFHYFLSNR